MIAMTRPRITSITSMRERAWAGCATDASLAARKAGASGRVLEDVIMRPRGAGEPTIIPAQEIILPVIPLACDHSRQIGGRPRHYLPRPARPRGEKGDARIHQAGPHRHQHPGA